MPKGKGGVNEKAVEARERKAAAKAEASIKAAKQQEDAYWASQGEGLKSKAQAKRDEQDRKKAEAAAKKAELKRLEEEEQEALRRTKPSPKALRVSGPKVTHYEINQQREEEERQKEAIQRDRYLAAKRVVTEESYSRMVDTENTNRQQDVMEARSVTEALAVLGINDNTPDDKHPEKRMRSAWQAFEKRELPLLKAEKPNLKLPQYRDMLYKMWQKSPDNPMNAGPSPLKK